MLTCAQLFIDVLEAKDFRFSVRELDDGDVMVGFPYQGKETRCIFSGDDGEYLTLFMVYDSIPENDDSKFADLLLVFNELNSKYKWTTFYIDDDRDLIVKYNAILTVDSAADVAYELLLRYNQIIEECKPVIMKAIWS